jgi:hypothetical protein
MPRQHIRTFDISVEEQRVEFFDNLARRSRLRTGVAPAVASAVVCADPSCCSQFRLNEAPVERKPTQPGIEHNGGAAFPEAVNVQP